ncbi:Cbb3-type cytochrome oxidase, subunit 3 [Monaibacterium marinum]|uniref:Cbb3-type cytochrome oxidase, subunit 3 n=1 Tax=Pontivivens marinum TaxID=1690039 RepID=A0A2C9CRK1_9RHOB|nr:cbb3-type cytochrome c oxidase subunit 3 [Monaibacterium marinum]SOH93833.1 Cbb3-type cytochrome oxidase, subunit 3 [Monaibacterium marinum]
MDMYSTLREIADSWVLLGLTLFFIGTVFWAFRPGSRDLHSDASAIPFRDDEPRCQNACPDCTCKGAIAALEERHDV